MSLISTLDPNAILGGYTVPPVQTDPFGQTIMSGFNDLLGAGFSWGAAKIHPVTGAHTIAQPVSTITGTTTSGITPRWIWVIVAVAGVALMLGVMHR